MTALPTAEDGPGPTGTPNRPGRTLIVSNRLPVTACIEDGEVSLRQSDGGLASGLRGVHESEEGLWIGWSGLTDGASVNAHQAVACRLSDLGALPVRLSDAEFAGYYRGYSNGALWPVLHDCLRQPVVVNSDWEIYRTVNERYADLVAQHLRPDDRLWIHDFHLMLLPRLVRDRCPDAKIGFFLHTPFPPAESFATLRQASALLEGVLGADRIGFHTRNYARNFRAAVELILGRSISSEDSETGATGPSIFACPMGVDVELFAAWARTPSVTAEAARLRSKGRGPLFVGIDRLDYTKGIVERLEAFERLLAVEPSLRGHARLIQIAVPSREDAAGYTEYRERVETLVERINRGAGDGWTPVDYRYTRVDTATLVALYSAADIMLVTPLCDGMNLVAKEFVACREDEAGVLVLSSTAGAAAELRAAVLTEAHDPDNLLRAYRIALNMTAVEQWMRMRHLRASVQRHDVLQWAQRCLEGLGRTADAAARQPVLRLLDAEGAPRSARTY
jgi:trehalose 6-phosphate synthase/phosphatase